MLRINVLPPEEVERIQARSLDVLERSGIIVHYPVARQLLAARGATVDEARGLVRIPRRLVEEALAAAPRRVTVYGQTDTVTPRVLGLDGGHYARTTTGLNWIVDYRAIKRRPVRRMSLTGRA